MSDFDNKTNSLYNYIKEIEAREKAQRRIRWYSFGVSLFVSGVIFSFVWYQQPFQQASATPVNSSQLSDAYVRFTTKTYKKSLARKIIERQGKGVIVEYPHGLTSDTLRNLEELNRFSLARPGALPDKVRQNESTLNLRSAQQQADKRTRPYIVVDKMPQFPGGKTALARYLQSKLRYPSEAKDHNVEGSVQVRFVIEANGKVSQLEVVEGIGFGCDEEAIRLISQMPNWIPGENGGKPVPVYKALAIQFQLM